MKPGQRPARIARSDAELLQRVAARDVEALGDLYDRYARDAWRVARRIVGTDADSEDVVHAVFIKLPEIASSYDGRASSWGWLCGVTVRLALRHRRGAGRFRRMLEAFAAALVRTPPADPERQRADIRTSSRSTRRSAG
jgi:RNA polymerase sigma-70 factor, ECF subfamily